MNTYQKATREGAEAAGSPLQIDLRGALAAKGVRLPAPVVNAVGRLLCVKELNTLLRTAYPARGSAFGRRIAEILSIRIDVEWGGLGALSGPVVFVSNHPLGGMDGIALITVLGERFGDAAVRCPVNDLLMAVEPLRDLFLPINKYGSQGRRAAAAINAAWEDPATRMVMFPAGLVSRQQREGGSIADLAWQKSFVTKALATGRTVVPVRFEARNSGWFYRVARWRKRIGLKVNVEQLLLPRQLFYQRGKTLTVRFLEPVSPARLRALGPDDHARAAAVRALVERD